MAGPWEKYQSTAALAETGPWAKYQAAPPSAAATGSQAVQAPDTPAQEAGHKLADVPYKSPMEFWQERQDALGKQMGDIGDYAKSYVEGKNEPEVKERGQAALMRGAEGFAGAPVTGKLAEVGALTKVPKIKTGALEAHESGYVFPPRMISEKPGASADVMAGDSGKIKLAQLASEKNQPVTNSLAHKSLEIPQDQMLSEKVFDDFRAKHGEAYEAVKNSIATVKQDATFQSAVAGLGKMNTEAAKFFPGLMKNPEVDLLQKELAAAKQFPPAAAVELVKELRFNAKGNLRSLKPSDNVLGLAQREAANALDELVERNIEAAAKPQIVRVGGQTYTLSQGDPALAGVVQKYRDARQKIAMAHDVEAVTNTATGDVSARGLAALARRGRPLSGELKTIADAANTFPKAFQNAGAFGGVEPLSILDIGTAVAAAPHHPMLSATMLARPIARRTVLGERMQRRMIEPRPVGEPTGGDLIPLVPPLSQALQPKPLSETAEEADGR